MSFTLKDLALELGRLFSLHPLSLDKLCAFSIWAIDQYLPQKKKKKEKQHMLCAILLKIEWQFDIFWLVNFNWEVMYQVHVFIDIFFPFRCWTVPECYTMVAESKFQVAWHSILLSLSSLYYCCEQGIRTQTEAATVTLWSSRIDQVWYNLAELCWVAPRTLKLRRTQNLIQLGWLD